jgi:sigma-54 dependent transcriptional regulator, acetoin dehydrogenase operon transcriptional activator AcoR
MDASGVVRELASPFDGLQRQTTRERAEALLAAIESVQHRAEVTELTESAALAVLSLAAATAAVVYFDAAELRPQLAIAGGSDGAAAEALAAALRDLLRSGTAAPYLFLAGGSIVAAPFRAGTVRGGVLAKREAGFFDDADGRTLAQFARHLATAAASVWLLARTRRVERIEQAVLDALGEGVVIAVDGRVKVFNRAAARILATPPEAAVGASLLEKWPALALLAAGGALDDEPVRVGDKDLLVSVRPIPESRPRVAAVVSFTEARTPARARRSSASVLFGFDDLVGDSAALHAVRKVAQVAKSSDSSLVIEGESGVGKEVLAQAIHSGGARSRAPFVAVHCAAIPRDLLESELFGYQGGAFTGASPHGHEGKFEFADGGTLLLDDVVELPLEMQAKLLRILQERSLTRLGGSRSRTIDVRIVATANVPLRDAVASGRFRSDLFYRLNVLHIAIPPLRERRADIRPLAERFLRKYAEPHGRRLRTLGAEALSQLEEYSWPGNVRELEHWIENEVHFAAPSATCLERLTRRPSALEQQRASAHVRPMCEVEKDLYAGALGAAAGSITQAARTLGISRGKLYRKLRLYGLFRG